MPRNRVHVLALLGLVVSLSACAAESDPSSSAGEDPTGVDDLTASALVVFEADGTVKLPHSLVAGQRIKVRRMSGRANPCGSGLGEDFHVAGFAFGHESGEIALHPGPAGSNVSLFEEGTMTVPNTGSVGFYMFVRRAIPSAHRDYCYDSNSSANYVVPVAHH
jgi:hypothetical protein